MTTISDSVLPDIGASVRVIDLFCGVGGLSLGLKNAGLEVAAGFDVDGACRYAYETGTGAAFKDKDILETGANDLNELFGDAAVRVLAGCAPCQPFSRYTTKRGQADDRWRLLLEFLRLVKEVKPEIVTMENVPGLARLDLWQEFVEGLTTLNYKVDWKVLDASEYGVPQQRHRLVLIGSLLGPISLPEPSKEKITVRDVLGALPAVAAGESHAGDRLHGARTLSELNMSRMKASVAGGSWKTWPEELRADCHKVETGKTYGSVYGRMSWDRPSPTITTQFYGFGNGRFGHPSQDRAITLREGALLQSFPPDFSFLPDDRPISVKHIGRLIGNAVPPKLAEAIGSTIRTHVISNTAASGT